MVKRVKDLTQKPTDNTQVDSTKLVSEVEETTKLAQISESAVEESTAPKRKPTTFKKKVTTHCVLCEQGIDPKNIRYYDVALLKKFISLRGKILPRSKTGLCSTHQRAVVKAIKRARQVALLPYLSTGID